MSTFGGRAKWPLRLLLVAASLLLVFLGLEAAMRVASPGQVAPSFRALFMPDDRIGYRPRPGASGHYKTPEFETTIAINSAGVRDDRELGAKAPGEFRIVVLGDSMVMAVQVRIEDTFVRRLEDRLNASGGPRVRVINAGVQGYGTVEQALFLRYVASAFEPDLVLLTVFVGNDAAESAAAEQMLEPRDRVADSSAVPAAAPEPQGSRTPLWLRRLARRSAFLQYVRLRVLAAAGPAGPLPLRERGVLSYAVEPPPEILRGFEVSRNAARRITEEAAVMGARTAVLFLPARFQLVEKDFADLSVETRKEGVRLDRDGATRRFRAAYAELEIPQLDLLEQLRRKSDPAALYFEQNIHLSARGHAEVAAAIESFLRSEQLVTGPH
ncbi:MAG TPA: hypothetical protein VLD67_04500 [Vicinamibacterales bacterium]|nr:hypothetical protein [Vicinamibacterales bacterium]